MDRKNTETTEGTEYGFNYYGKALHIEQTND